MKAICSKCKIEKDLTEFKKDKSKKLGRSSQCKECQKSYAKSYQKENLDKWHEYNKKWRRNNLDQSKMIAKNYYENNKESHLQRMKIYRELNPEYNKKYWQKEEVKANHRKYRAKKRKDPKFRLYENIRGRIYQAIINKNNSTYELLDCNIEDYIVYLENQFTKKMSWDNYGTYWEIDHIIPLSKGGSFHYTNTQPLTISENRTKKNKL